MAFNARATIRRYSLPVGLAIVLLGSLAGCREEEQDRPLVYEKGTYRGAQDQQLSEGEIKALQQRGRKQRF